MTLATVRVVVSKELSTSHDCCLNQHGYIRSRQTSLGRVSIHTHTVGRVRCAWRPSHPQSAVSTHTQSLGHLLTSGKQPASSSHLSQFPRNSGYQWGRSRESGPAGAVQEWLRNWDYSCEVSEHQVLLPPSSCLETPPAPVNGERVM